MRINIIKKIHSQILQITNNIQSYINRCFQQANERLHGAYVVRVHLYTSSEALIYICKRHPLMNG